MVFCLTLLSFYLLVTSPEIYDTVYDNQLRVNFYKYVSSGGGCTGCGGWGGGYGGGGGGGGYIPQTEVDISNYKLDSNLFYCANNMC